MKEHMRIDKEAIDKAFLNKTIYEGEDGLLYCAACNHLLSRTGHPKHIFHFSPCQICSKIIEHNSENEKWLAGNVIKSRINNCFADKRSFEHTFKKDNLSNSTVSTIIKENYLKNFDTYKEQGKGLLLWGAPGTGKTFYADALLHELIKKGLTAKKYSLPKQFRGFVNNRYAEDILAELKRYQVVCIDDLGAERDTPSMIEFVYSVIDELYANKIIIIFTTNLNYEEMKKSAFGDGIGRIYSRVVGSCIPLEVNKNNQRVNEIKDIIPLWNETNAALKEQGLIQK